MRIQATNVFERHYQAVQDGYRIICHRGGSRSSKTWSIFQYLLLEALKGEELTITIARDKLSWIKPTLLKDFQELTTKYNITVTPNINHNRQDQIYYINNTEFGFFGLDYPEKLHGRKQNITWLNEVMEVDRKSFDQLEMRTTDKMILDYNPYDESHWVFDLLKRPDVIEIVSTMLDNPFLPDPIKKKIRSYEPTPENIKQGTADEYMWQVYGLGEKGKLQGAIFENWDIVDNIPNNAKLLGYGMDFGYTNDPTTLVALYVLDQELYADELLYQTNMTNQDIINYVKNTTKDNVIYADSAEPKSIEEIKRGGVRITGADKGQGSINFGIDLLKSYKINITKRSNNLEKEFRKYKWATDRNGNSLNKPIEAFNHMIDALRYVGSSTLKSKTNFAFISNY